MRSFPAVMTTLLAAVHLHQRRRHCWRQRRRQRLLTSRRGKKACGDFACACLQLVHGARVRVAVRRDQSHRFFLFVFCSAHLGKMVRLILMRIQFRAQDFGQIAKSNLVRENRKRLLVRNRMRRWCSGHLCICSCRSAVRSLDAENSRQCRLQLCLRREETRRVHFARPRTQASEPAVTASSLAEKGRADALRVTFFQQPNF